MAKTQNSSPAAAQPGAVKLDRPITLIGAIALVVGGVVGMGIYALIAGIGAEAGSTLWLAFVLAMVISVVGVAPLIQIASALPRAGAGYLYTSRLLNPLMGTVVSYWAILGVACSTCFVSLGLAGYIAPYLPWDIPVKVLALILPCLFFLVYLFRLRLATWLQILLVVQLIVALLVYAGVGSFQYDMQFSLSLPQAAGGLIMAVVLCYSACMGFQVIGEMGEEMVNARRNIPLAIAIGGAIILIVYIFVGTVFISSVPYDYEAIKGMTAPLVDSGRAFLS
ncbi:MAG: amino acid permease, partial [Dehalococcoidia bacterium]|nr:amino acid permease [Dehalococcoidia bacterium]